MWVDLKCVLAAALFAGMLGACSPDASTGSQNATQSQASAMPAIGLVLSNESNPFFKEMKQGAEDAARENNLQLLTEDAQDDTLKQIGEIRALITKKVRVLLVNPTDSVNIAGAIALANQAGIPVISLDRSISGGGVVTHIASDNLAGGKMAAEFIKDRLGGRGRVVELLGLPGVSASLERDRGFMQALKPARRIRLVARQPADFERARAQQVMRDILRKQGHIDAVFALNDEMALGALAALHQAGLDHVLVVGFDASTDALVAIRAHRLAATIGQRPDLIGWEGVLTARKLIDHAPVENYIPIPLELVKL